MINKQSDNYSQIKKNIIKLNLIQSVTGFSPYRLTALFLFSIYKDINNSIQYSLDDIGIKLSSFADASAYKYFCKLKAQEDNYTRNSESYNTFLERIQTKYLTRAYVGQTFDELRVNFSVQEKVLKDFVREAFKSVFPLTPEMTPLEKAQRNQKLGKMGVDMWIGDVIRYKFFNDAPGFMMKNVTQSLTNVDLFILNLLHDQELDHDIMKFCTNQNLEEKLVPKQTVKPKTIKI